MPRIVLLFALCSITAIGQVPELPVSPKATHPLFDPDDRPPKHPLREKLDNIIFPKVEFDAVPFETVVNYLKTRSRELDPDGEGVNFFLQLDPEVEEALITVDFHNIPLGALLHYLCMPGQLHYHLGERAVEIASATIALGDMETRFYPITDAFIQDVGDSDDWDAVTAYFEGFGVMFREGSKLTYNARTQKLIVTQTIDEFRKIERILQALMPSPVQVRIDTELQVVDDPRLAEIASPLIDKRLLARIADDRRQSYAQLSAVTLNGATCKTIYEGNGVTVDLEATPMLAADGATLQLDLSWQATFVA